MRDKESQNHQSKKYMEKSENVTCEARENEQIERNERKSTAEAKKETRDKKKKLKPKRFNLDALISLTWPALESWVPPKRAPDGF